MLPLKEKKTGLSCLYYSRSLCLVAVKATAAIKETPTERTRMIKWQDIQVCSFCLWKGKSENEFFSENYQLINISLATVRGGPPGDTAPHCELGA